MMYYIELGFFIIFPVGFLYLFCGNIISMLFHKLFPNVKKPFIVDHKKLHKFFGIDGPVKYWLGFSMTCFAYAFALIGSYTSAYTQIVEINFGFIRLKMKLMTGMILIFVGLWILWRLEELRQMEINVTEFLKKTEVEKVLKK